MSWVEIRLDKLGTVLALSSLQVELSKIKHINVDTLDSQ